MFACSFVRFKLCPRRNGSVDTEKVMFQNTVDNRSSEVFFGGVVWSSYQQIHNILWKPSRFYGSGSQDQTGQNRQMCSQPRDLEGAFLIGGTRRVGLFITGKNRFWGLTSWARPWRRGHRREALPMGHTASRRPGRGLLPGARNDKWPAHSCEHRGGVRNTGT